jgi:hypothetical protein
MTHLVVVVFSNGESRGYHVEADSAREAIERIRLEFAPVWGKEKGGERKGQNVLISGAVSERSEIIKI